MRRKRTKRGWRVFGGIFVVVVSAWLVVGGGFASGQGAGGPESVELPGELERVLRDYEAAWEARDAEGLAALFVEDGFVLPRGRRPVRGRDAIREYYEGQGGPLTLRAYAYAVEGDVGWIIGGYAGAPDRPEAGKFTLTLRREPSGKWAIFSDMDNPG